MQRSCGMMGYHLITAGDLGYPEFGIKISIKFLNSWMGTTWGCCDFSGPARAGPGWPIARALCLLVSHRARFRKYLANSVNCRRNTSSQEQRPEAAWDAGGRVGKAVSSQPGTTLLEIAFHPNDPFSGSSACPSKGPEWLPEAQFSSALKFQPHKPRACVSLLKETRLGPGDCTGWQVPGS